MPICLVSACLLGNGRGWFGSPSWGDGGRGGAGGEPGGVGGERDAEREAGRQTAKQMAARGGGVPAGSWGGPQAWRERENQSIPTAASGLENKRKHPEALPRSGPQHSIR